MPQELLRQFASWEAAVSAGCFAKLSPLVLYLILEALGGITVNSLHQSWPLHTIIQGHVTLSIRTGPQNQWNANQPSSQLWNQMLLAVPQIRSN